MQTHREPEVIPYASRPPREAQTIHLWGVVSLLFCLLLQYPWLGVLGWVLWAFIWGDNEPGRAQWIIVGMIGMVPSATAVALGLVAATRSRIPVDRGAGILGIIGGASWIVYALSNGL